MPLQALRLFLDTGSARPEQLPPEVEQEYLGGRGAAVWMLTHRLPRNTGPLSPANLLIFSTGPLSGTLLGATGGFVVSTRSPLTGAIAHSWAEGGWGGALRRAGYDLLAIEGQSAQWCVVLIDGATTSVESAEGFLGLDTYAAEQALRARYGNESLVLCLGPAGEAGVSYSSIVAEGRYMAEPAGTGSVMAAKRIKAIVVRGGPQVPMNDAGRVQSLFANIAQRAATSELAQGVRQYGSNYYLPFVKEWGALTGRNGQDGRAQHMIALTRNMLAQRGKRETFGCAGCPLECHSQYVRKSGEPLAFPELEAVVGFGGSCGLTSIDSVILANDLCFRLGLDVVSTSAAIAFMLECQQEGLSSSGTLHWGDDEAVLQTITRLGQKQEKRDIISLGVGEMQEVFFGSSSFAPQVKGLAMPGLDPRALNEIALAVTTSPIGGDYRYAMAYEELLADPPSWLPDEPSHPQAVKGKASRLIWHERFAAALDSAGLCRRMALLAYQLTPAELAELLSAALGRSFTGVDLAKLGERVITAERLFLQTHATVSSADKLAARWREQPLKDGRATGHLPAFADLLAEYYKRHGWDEQGVPTAKRLAELNLGR